MPAIESERLTLHPLSLEYLEVCLHDFQQMEEALGLEVTDTTLSEPVRRAIALKVLKIAENPQDYEWHTYWLVILKEENRAIGLIGFKGSPDEHNEVEIGYGIELPYRGRGFVTEAARRLIEWAQERMSGLAVLAETDKSNVPSERVLEKLGFAKTSETEFTSWWKLPPA